MNDPRNFIEYTIDRFETDNMRKPSADELAREFEKVGHVERLDHISKINGQLQASDLSVEEAAKFHAYRRALINTHRRLRDIDR